MSKGTILVDFDGPIHKYSKGWHTGEIYDEPVEGAAFTLQKFLDLGYQVVIYTARIFDKKFSYNVQEGKARVENWLLFHKIPYSSIFTGIGKPIAKLYIDDRGLRFEGNWTEAREKALEILGE